MAAGAEAHAQMRREVRALARASACMTGRSACERARLHAAAAHILRRECSPLSIRNALALARTRRAGHARTRAWMRARVRVSRPSLLLAFAHVCGLLF